MPWGIAKPGSFGCSLRSARAAAATRRSSSAIHRSVCASCCSWTRRRKRRSSRRGTLGRQEDQLDLVVGRPGADACVFGRGEVVRHHIQLLPGPAGTQSLEADEELAPALARADGVVQLAGGQIEGGEHMPHATCAVVGSPQSARTPHRPPRLALAGIRFSGPNSSTHITRPSAGVASFRPGRGASWR